MTGKIMTRHTKTHRRGKPSVPQPEPVTLFRVSKHAKAKQPPTEKSPK